MNSALDSQNQIINLMPARVLEDFFYFFEKVRNSGDGKAGRKEQL